MKSSLKAVKFLVFVMVCHVSFCWGSKSALAEDIADPNVVLAFKTMFAETSTDNLDGAFKPLVEQALREVFQANPRFQVVTDRKGADGIIKTQILKKAAGLDVEVRIEIGSTGETFTIDHRMVDAQVEDSTLRRAILGLLKVSLQKIPFYGTVTGRDNNQVTLDIGSYQGIKAGDLVQIGRVDSFKRHPLLKQVIDVQMASVGTIRINQVEEGLAFGEVVEEVPGEKLRRLHKVTAIQHPIKDEPISRQESVKEELGYGVESIHEGQPKPRYGMVSLGIGLGSFTNTTQVGTANINGGGFYPSFQLVGEAWLTSQFFAELALEGGVLNHTYTGGTTAGTTGTTTSTTALGVNGGYRFLFDNSIYGPQLSVKLGYYNFHWAVPTVTADYLTARTYSGLNVGFGGQVPFGRNQFGASIQINILLFPSYGERDLVLTSSGSSTVARFYLGGYYFFSSQLSVKVGLDFQSYSRDFDATQSTSTQQKIIGFVPSVQYYF